VITGTPPITVVSTTVVPNLSATNTQNANTTNDVLTAVPVYPTFVTGTAGFQGQRVANSRLSFIPSTGALTATTFNGSLNGNATSASTLNGLLKFTNVSPSGVPPTINSGSEVEVSYPAALAAITGTVTVSPVGPLANDLGILSARISAAGIVSVKYRYFAAAGTVILTTPLNITVIQ
jgi:hypothetical protein